jgi:DNA-binding response OmpR family regulator
MAKILLLEDDEVLASTLVEILEDAAYDVDLAKDGIIAAEYAYENQYDLYIFDINVPGMDGLELLESLRNSGDTTATIYISALVDLDSISKGFESGGDDYLKKPFLPEELLIRVDARLKNHAHDKLVYRDVTYYPDTKEIYKDGKIISLGSVQFKIFDNLMHNIGKVTHKEVLLELLEHPSDTALRVALVKLKQKLDIEITNVRGLGYILEKA